LFNTFIKSISVNVKTPRFPEPQSFCSYSILNAITEEKKLMENRKELQGSNTFAYWIFAVISFLLIASKAVEH